MNKNIERTGWGHVLYEERPGGRRCSYCHALHARRLRLRETLSFPDPVSFLVLVPLVLVLVRTCVCRCAPSGVRPCRSYSSRSQVILDEILA